MVEFSERDTSWCKFGLCCLSLQVIYPLWDSVYTFAKFKWQWYRIQRIPVRFEWDGIYKVPHLVPGTYRVQFSSVQFSLSIMSNYVRPHEPQHARSPCPSPIAGVHPNPCPLSRWCDPIISSSVVPFSFPQSFPASGSFQMSQLFTSDGHYWSFSFNISPSNEHPGLISLRMDWLDLLAVHGTLRSLLQHHSSKASILQHSAFFIVQLSHPYMTTGKRRMMSAHKKRVV